MTRPMRPTKSRILDWIDVLIHVLRLFLAFYDV
jgi:hypothetical protein